MGSLVIFLIFSILKIFSSALASLVPVIPSSDIKYKKPLLCFAISAILSSLVVGAIRPIKSILYFSIMFKENIFFVIDWYKNFYSNPREVYNLTINQILRYQKSLSKKKI